MIVGVAEIKDMMVQATQGLDKFRPQVLRNTLCPLWFVLPWIRVERKFLCVKGFG